MIPYDTIMDAHQHHTSFPPSWPRQTFSINGGWCRRCRAFHILPTDTARSEAAILRDRMERTESIALCDCNNADPNVYTTQPLFGTARGKMFGVLECRDTQGNTIWLYAFSGQINGQWTVPGWAPPLFDTQAFARINTPGEHRIKHLGRLLDMLPKTSPHRHSLRHERRTLSRRLTRDIHGLYRIPNFRGAVVSLDEAFIRPGGKPTGTGDCCAPKLLALAATRKLAPVSLTEFYFGRKNRSSTREHGGFYPPCVGKCRPLLGFMLCGADEMRTVYGC